LPHVVVEASEMLGMPIMVKVSELSFNVVTLECLTRTLQLEDIADGTSQSNERAVTLTALLMVDHDVPLFMVYSKIKLPLVNP
jgi:hypothetical protein